MKRDPLEDAFREAAGGRDAITSESEWQKFTSLLAGHGLVTAAEEQLDFQGLWERASKGVDSFGRSSRPRLSLMDVLKLAGSDRYIPKGAGQIDAAVNRLVADIKALKPLLDSWKIENLSPYELGRLITILDGLKSSHAAAVAGMERQASLRAQLATAEAVRRCSQGSMSVPLDSPIKWQRQNRTVVERAVLQHRASHIRFSDRDPAERSEVIKDSWGFTQGHDGCYGVQCFGATGVLSKGSREVRLAAVSLPLSGLPYRVQDSLLKTYQAHRQLAAGSAVCHVMGFRERLSSKEQLIYYENPSARPLSHVLHALSKRGTPLDEDSILFRHIARGTLKCFAELQEQSTFGMSGRLSTDNVMVGSKGQLVRLGNVPWGVSRSKTDEGNKIFFAERDCSLSEDLAVILEQLLGMNEGAASAADLKINAAEAASHGVRLSAGQSASIQLRQPVNPAHTQWRLEAVDSFSHPPVKAALLKLADGNRSGVRTLEVQGLRKGHTVIECVSHEPFCSPCSESDRCSFHVDVRPLRTSIALQAITSFCRAQRTFWQAPGLGDSDRVEERLVPPEAMCLKGLLSHSYMAPIPTSEMHKVTEEYDRLLLS
jgi:hypothetical protein